LAELSGQSQGEKVGVDSKKEKVFHSSEFDAAETELATDPSESDVEATGCITVDERRVSSPC